MAPYDESIWRVWCGGRGVLVLLDLFRSEYSLVNDWVSNSGDEVQVSETFGPKIKILETSKNYSGK